MRRQVIAALLGITFVQIMTGYADVSLAYTNPLAEEYFRGSPGVGVLKVCKMDDVPDVKTMRVPAGTYFADQGPVQGYKSGEDQAWLLTVVTTQIAVLQPGRKCATVKARVANSPPPPAHPDMKAVQRFAKSDNRYFEITASDDPGAQLPDLPPWNSSYPSLKATAATDFK